MPIDSNGSEQRRSATGAPTGRLPNGQARVVRAPWLDVLRHPWRSLSMLSRQRRHAIVLDPLQELEDLGGGRFAATGSTPMFTLRSPFGSLPGGWTALSYRVEDCSTVFRPRLYIDAGGGFLPSSAIDLRAVDTGSISELVRLPTAVRGLRLQPCDRPASFVLRDVAIQEMGWWQLLTTARRTRTTVWPALRYLRRHGFQAMVWRIVAELQARAHGTYQLWIDRYDSLDAEDRRRIEARIATLSIKPVLSLAIIAGEEPEALLAETIASVQAQLYPHWQLTVGIAATAPATTVEMLAPQAADPRISSFSYPSDAAPTEPGNRALDAATGDFCAFVAPGDRLPPRALYMIAEEIAGHPDAEIVYSDEDEIDTTGQRFAPRFKSDWNPDLVLTHDAVGSLCFYRAATLRRLGKLRAGFGAATLYDLILRFAAAAEPDRLRHVPHILYHRRAVQPAEDQEARGRAATEHLSRLGRDAEVMAARLPRHHRIRERLPTPEPRVSVLIPTKDRVDLLERCVTGVLEETDYRNLEIIIIDNRSEEAATQVYFARIAQDPRVRIIAYDAPFNYSAINNLAAREATGEILLLLNNDIEIIEPHWLAEMVGQALRPEVGAVGAKLLYPDDTVQHAGVLIGVHRGADHAHKHIPRRDPGYLDRAELQQNLSAVTAACLAVRRSVYLEIGGLNEKDLRVAFNDTDFCLRLRACGYLIVWTPYAELYHHESVSRGKNDDTGPRRAEHFRELGYIQWHWPEVIAHDPYYNPNLSVTSNDFALCFPTRAKRPWD